MKVKLYLELMAVVYSLSEFEIMQSRFRESKTYIC